MSLEIALQENTAAINALIALWKGGASLPTADAPAKPATSKPVKPAAPASDSAAAVPETTVKEPASANQPATQASAAPTHTADEVKNAALALAKVKGRQALVDLLATFGAASTKDIPADKYADFIAKAA